MTRLTLKVQLSKEQAQAAKYLMDTPGTCFCGRFLKPLDPKFCIGQINTDYCMVPEAKNTLIVALFCEACYLKINNTFRTLAPQKVIEKMNE